VVLASGDPNFYGVGRWWCGFRGGARGDHPNLTGMPNRLRPVRNPAGTPSSTASTDARGTPGCGFRQPGPWLIYTRPGPPAGGDCPVPDWTGDCLSARFCVLEDLGQTTERITWMSLAEAQEREFSPLNLVVVEPEPGEATPGGYGSTWGSPKRHWTIRRLITKAEVRARGSGQAETLPGLVLWDVGAGCGSVGLEASLLIPGGKIFAVERHPERARPDCRQRDHFRGGQP